MSGGAPEGNNNAGRGTDWRDAIHYVLAEKGRALEGDRKDPAYKIGLREVAKKFVQCAEDGESWAMKELGDRTDGKPVQATELSGPDGGPIDMTWDVVVRDATDRDT